MSSKEKAVLLFLMKPARALAPSQSLFKVVKLGKEERYVQHVSICVRDCSTSSPHLIQSVGLSGKILAECSPVGAWLVMALLGYAIPYVASDWTKVRKSYLSMHYHA